MPGKLVVIIRRGLHGRDEVGVTYVFLCVNILHSKSTRTMYLYFTVHWWHTGL